MATYQSLENLLFTQTKKLQDLEIATDLIQGKNCIREELVSAYTEICSIAKDIQLLKQDVNVMKNSSEKCKELSSVLKSLNQQIQNMANNIPPKIMEYVHAELPQETFVDNNNSNNLEKDTQSNDDNRNKSNTDNRNKSNTDNINTSSIINCKKTLFVEPKKLGISPITPEEFSKIPKYIIGRYSLETLNSLLKSINLIIKNKYALVSLGKNGAKKKGELDLFLQFSKEQISLGPEERNTYFFTPDDYERHAKCKLDKTKLNLIIALRHCKRLREIRTAKAVHYALILPNS